MEFLISVQDINIEEEKIQVVKTWSEPKFIKDIYIFLGFANFYYCFIQGFCKIIALLISLLKTTSSLANVKTPLKSTKNSIFLTLKAKLAFFQLREAITKAPILHHFDTKHYIPIETDASDYVIGSIFSQLTLESGQWHPVAFFWRKIIPAKTWYKMHNQKLLAIVEVFKTWHHYLEDCKYKVFILTNYNHLHQFKDIKNLSLRQVHWA